MPRAVRIDEVGGPEVIRVEDVEVSVLVQQILRTVR